MNKREAKFLTDLVMPWMRANKKLYPNMVVEGKEVAVSCGDIDFEPQQLPSLRSAHSPDGITCKIPDGSGIATPFDAFHVSSARSFVAILYRGKGWVMIDIGKWDSKKKPRITLEEAKEMADHWYVV